MTPADGGAAFPSVCLGDPGHPSSLPGMSLCDWFAGQALLHSDAAYAGRPREVARKAYAIADAMLAERAARQERDQ